MKHSKEITVFSKNLSACYGQLIEKDNKPFNIYTNNLKLSTQKGSDVRVGVIGKVMPIKEKYDQFKNFSEEELVTHLYREHGAKFARFIKGIFIIVISDREKVLLVNDRWGIMKLFCSIKGNQVIFSNCLSRITQKISHEYDKEMLIEYCLMNNFTSGKTLFKNLFTLMPASVITLSDKVDFRKYWSFDELLEENNPSFDIEDILQETKTIFENSIYLVRQNSTRLTLTGGMDSRLILALLMNSGLKPTLFVYGMPLSADVLKAIEIKNRLKLELFNPLPISTYDEFIEWEDRTVEYDHAFLSLHRAYRYHGYESFVGVKNSSDVIFTGHMGGEIIKNFFYDGIAVSPFAKELICGHRINTDKFSNDIFLKANIKEEIKKAAERIKYTLGFESIKENNEFTYTFNHLIYAHHAQDINLCSSLFRYVSPFFLDYDFLRLLCNNGLVFFGKNRKKLNLRKLFYAQVIDSSCKDLSDITFSKRGEYSSGELLNSNEAVLKIKRLIRQKITKIRYSPGFVYEEWFLKFIQNHIINVETNPLLNELFDVKQIEKELSSKNHLKSENYWRRFSNIVYLDQMTRKHCSNEKD